MSKRVEDMPETTTLDDEDLLHVIDLQDPDLSTRDKKLKKQNAPFASATHASTHATAGGDPLAASDIGAEPTITPKRSAFNRDYGSTTGTVCQGNDTRLSNARTPTAHAVSHATGGADVLTPADIGAEVAGAAAAAVSAHDASATAHGDRIPSTAESAAIKGANAPSGGNVFATQADLVDVSAQPSYDTAQLLRDAGVPSGPNWITVTIGAITRGDGGGGNWYWDAASTADDNLGTVLNPTGNAGDGRWLREYSQLPNVRWFGAAGDGVTDDTDAIQATVDLNIGAYFPPGDFSITNTIIVADGSLVGERSLSIITNSGNGTAAIQYSTDEWINSKEISNLSVKGLEGGGHVLTFGKGCAYCTFHGLELFQWEPSASIIEANFPAAPSGIYDCKFTESYYNVRSEATAFPIDIICGGALFNENVFFNIRFEAQESANTPFVRIETTGTGSFYLENNVFQNINLQNGPGGFIRFGGCSRLYLKNCSMWDATLDSTRSIIEGSTVGSVENINCVIDSFKRIGGDLGVGFHDIDIGPSQDTILLNIGTTSGKSPSINVNSKRITVVGTALGLVNLNAIKNYTIIDAAAATGIETSTAKVNTILVAKDAADAGVTAGFESTALATYITSNSIPLRIDRTTNGNVLAFKQSGVTYGNIGRDITTGSLKLDFTSGVGWFTGTGDPSGVIGAGVGSLFLRTNGGTGTTLYVKETGGTSSTGWTNYAGGGGGGGEANTGENIGTGVEVYAGMNGTVLQSRSIIDTANVEWTQGATELSAFVPANTFDTFGAAAAVSAAKWGTGDTVDHWFDTHQSFTLTGNQSVNLTGGHDIKVVGDSSDRNVDFLVTPPTAGQALNWVVDYDNSANAMTVTWLANGSGLTLRPTPLPSLSGGRYLLSFRLTASDFQWISAVELA